MLRTDLLPLYLYYQLIYINHERSAYENKQMATYAAGVDIAFLRVQQQTITV